MKILNDCINALKKIATTRKKSVINRSFIISISIIYSVLILATAASFQYSMNVGAAILFDALKSYNEDLIGRRIGMLVERLRERGAASKENMRNEIENFNFEGDILCAVFFTKTDDENYFRILHTIPLRSGFDLNLAENATVRENKKINYLRKGLLHRILDPGIYSKDEYRWQSIYYPYQFKNRKGVLQFLVSAARTEEAVKNYRDLIKNIRIFNIFMTLFLVLAVVVISGVFVQNYSLLIKNLTSRLNKAARGDLDVSLNQTSDSDLNLLALSFNTLIEELKEKTDRRTDAEGVGTLFYTGVAILKENRLDDAVAVFKTLTLVKPQGFSSYFNLGVAYAKKLEYANALAAFEQALSINPTHELTRSYINKIKGIRD